MSPTTVDAPAQQTVGPRHDVRGAIRVQPRALEKAVRESIAHRAGAPRETVNVDLADWGGALTVKVATKLPIPELSQTGAIQAEMPLLERVRALQTALVSELGLLTGREIRRVSVVVTGAIIPEQRRVR